MCKIESLVFRRKVILSRDVPGQRSLPRDFCSCPCPGTKGQRDKEIFLSQDLPQDVLSLGNPSMHMPLLLPFFFFSENVVKTDYYRFRELDKLGSVIQGVDWKNDLS